MIHPNIKTIKKCQTTYVVQIKMSFTSTVTWYFIHRLQLISIAWHWYFLTHSLMNHVKQISNLQYIINWKEFVCHNKYVIPKGASQSNWSKIQVSGMELSVNFLVGEFLTQSIHCRLGRCGNLKDCFRNTWDTGKFFLSIDLIL